MTDKTDIARIDIAVLLAPLSEAAPCGDNLEYDPLFLSLEEAVQGKPEVQYGNTITPATPPDWQAVRGLALQLMERSRDLRLAVALARALLGLDGVPGLADGLALLAGLLTEHWDGVHPQLDADDGNDPMLRVNVLAALCQQAGLLRELRETPLVRVRALGSFSLRDIELSSGDGDAPAGQQKVAPAVIEATFAEADQAALAATVAALDAAAASAHGIEQLLTDKVGVGSALDLAPLVTLLRRAADTVRPHLRGAGAAELSQAADGGGGPQGQGGAAGMASGAAFAAAPRDEIASRADVTRMLDKLCAYYAAHEPSSPVPLLLQRARKLVDKSFTELLQDLAPDGLGQLAQVSGVRQDG
jgi:type VI secretion system protein ImpA